MQFGGVPVVAALAGAVMGGGLEIAACCHVRVAEEGTMFRMPEGQRGIFVGGGGTVRIGAIIGADRLTEMMLTGRTYSAEEGRRSASRTMLHRPAARLPRRPNWPRRSPRTRAP